jgi:hypothetical protein
MGRNALQIDLSDEPLLLAPGPDESVQVLEHAAIIGGIPAPVKKGRRHFLLI